ncbi:transcriptional repressor [Massilia sp. PAMC28688]|uniref:Fur family transcriptional regulator n=1 Tax=Massilia sp. PAMC28688 TaxID=2861283 RepID=UPI001C62B27B|nr:transcriptional repressor [Massilia sp. PAMC28688]QYF94463.1 transcriptional repressor [Massilia sp. PAMC28688]
MNSPSFLARAEVLITETGSRLTGARVRVLGFLLAQQAAVTHHDIEGALGGAEKIDRVTLYRTLDWLVAQGLAHKMMSEDRVWRFRANESAAAHRQHAHFKCERCATMICLGGMAAAAKSLALPPGYRALEVEMTVKGLCPACA